MASSQEGGPAKRRPAGSMTDDEEGVTGADRTGHDNWLHILPDADALVASLVSAALVFVSQADPRSELCPATRNQYAWFCASLPPIFILLHCIAALRERFAQVTGPEELGQCLDDDAPAPPKALDQELELAEFRDYQSRESFKEKEEKKGSRANQRADQAVARLSVDSLESLSSATQNTGLSRGGSNGTDCKFGRESATSSSSRQHDAASSHGSKTASFDTDGGASIHANSSAFTSQAPKRQPHSTGTHPGSPKIFGVNPSPSSSIRSTALTELFFSTEFERRNLVNEGGRGIFEVSGEQQPGRIGGSFAGHGSPKEAVSDRACKSLGHHHPHARTNSLKKSDAEREAMGAKEIESKRLKWRKNITMSAGKLDAETAIPEAAAIVPGALPMIGARQLTAPEAPSSSPAGDVEVDGEEGDTLRTLGVSSPTTPCSPTVVARAPSSNTSGSASVSGSFKMMMGLMYTDAAHVFLDQQEKLSKPERGAISGGKKGQRQQMTWGASGRSLFSSFSSKLFSARQDSTEEDQGAGAGAEAQESSTAE